MSGAHTLEEAYHLQDKVSSSLQNFGFKLRKWASNTIELLNHINEDDKERVPVNINDDSTYLKLLGIQWHPVKDEFSFNVCCDAEMKPTKRNILSFSARIFDPLGWLAPVIINLKIIFQKLWLLQLDWDDEIPLSTAEKWLKVKNQMAYIQNLSIPRWLLTTSGKLELHGFADASEDAYAAVVYCRTISETGIINVRLMAARTKVAPINQISIPRLELCAAVLLKRLLTMIKDTLGGEIEITAWTDSTIVLSWLASHPRRWKTFIANRTANILSFLSRNHWKHVQSSHNPADCASRGLLPQEVISHKLWWNGPDWLWLDSSHWPNQPQQLGEAPEEKLGADVLISTMPFTSDILPIISQRCSSFHKFINIIGWIKRFYHNLRHASQRLTSNVVTIEEIIASKMLIYKLLQLEYFSDELKDIQTRQVVSKKSKLYQFNPFIDDDNIMRVGGRIQHSSVDFNTRHPIILPRCYITKLLVTELHHKNMHAGATLLTSITRQN